ncbi:MAG: hypothetical protein IPJ01_10100 [Micavibrio sp.]|nr:hypothetical protein [Micavibrio sp.]
MENQKTLDALRKKASSSFSKARMPSIKKIKDLLDELGIENYLDTTTNVVEYRSKGRTYVNSRHNGKNGYYLGIGKSHGYKCHEINMDSSDSYYSWNTYMYAGQIINLIDNKK